MAEENYPSAPKRREVDLGKGVVILPPERMVTERKEEKKPKPEKRQESAARESRRDFGTTAAPAMNQLLIIGLTLVAVISLILSIISMTSVANMKSELGGIAASLRAYSEGQIEVTTQLNQPHTITASVPIRDALSPFSIPIPTQEIQGEGAISIILPGYNYPVSIPWQGTFTVFGSVTTNISGIGSDEKLNIQYTLPSSGDLTMALEGQDLLSDELQGVIDSLERLSR